MEQLQQLDVHLTVVESTETGLYLGALYQNKPTPSGMPRYLLSATTNQEYLTVKSAALAINAQFPEVGQIDVESIEDESALEYLQLVAKLPRHAHITFITPQRGNQMEEGVKQVEVRPYDSVTVGLLDIDITPRHLKRLVARKVIHHVGSTGPDPELYYCYDYYQVN